MTQNKLDENDKTVLISLKVPKRLWAAFKQAAKADGYNASEIIRLLMADYLDEE